jgi:hypothetical protein
MIAFAVTLLPIAYLSFINRATGDDYGYAVYTREAWQLSHSIIPVIKAACRTVRDYYYGWQGTWFDIFLFALQPEVFSNQAYVITAFLMLVLWIGSTFLMFREILIVRLHFDKWIFYLFTLIFLIISIQFIPSTKSSLFWYNGCAHYMIPFAIDQILVFFLLRFCDKYQYSHLIVCCVFMTFLGGANYQAALFGLIAAAYIGIGNYVYKRNRRILLLLIPIILEMAGLVISIKAPGNKNRGGEDFGFSMSRAANAVALSFVDGLKDIWDYMKNKPFVFVGLIILFLILLHTFEGQKDNIQFITHPIICAIALFCLYSAMQTPALYAQVSVSGGVYNMNFQVFLLTASGLMTIIAQRIVLKLGQSANGRIIKYFYIAGLVVSIFILLIGRSNIKTSTMWICMDYIISGQAADYKEQMDLQTQLLTDDEVDDVILPSINDQQGPLMHMPVTENPDAWTNTVVKNFYKKNSVISIPREEWEITIR